MNLPGNILKKEREQQKKSLSDIARSLNINVDYLKAIEEDQYDVLPAEVFTTAYLRLYANNLGLDSDRVLSLYKSQHVVIPDEDSKKEETPPDRSIVPLKPVLLIIFLVLAVVVLIFTLSGDKDEKYSEPAVVPEETEISENNIPERLSLKIIASELTWVSVTLDDRHAREWLLRSGDEIEVNAEQQFKIKIGNAGGTRLIFNGEDIGSLGPHGRIVDVTLPENNG